MRKRLLSFVLAVLMIASLLPATALAADIVDSGTCGAEGDGSNLTWTLDSEGVLTISGSGDMYDYGSSDAPWHGRVKSAVIAEGVTSIGEYAFYDCRSLTSVTIPDSVTSIGDDAFNGCESLTSVTIPDSVTSIGGNTFRDCISLTSVTIPDSVTSIGGCAFMDCSSLKSVTIPDSVTIIGGSAFSDCDNLTDVYYTGTEIAWNKIKISDYNDALKNATIHYFSEWTREKEPTCTCLLYTSPSPRDS